MKTILYVAGKSGGHIIPALTLAQAQQLHEPTHILFFSTNAALDAQLIASCTAIKQHIPLPLNGVSPKHPFFLFKMIHCGMISLKTLWRYKPERVISTGGLVSVPVCFAAWLLRIPFEIYEFNVEPGSAVKLLAPLAQKVHTCFEKTGHYLRGTTVTTAYPVRYSITERISLGQARSSLDLPQDKKILMIVGGSQGSHFLNKAIQQCMTQFSEQELQQIFVIHQTGAQQAKEMEQFYEQLGVPALVFDYRDDIALCYQAADYIITRAGAGVLHELLFFHKRALIIPLEVDSTSHQIANAIAFVERDPASWMMLRQHDLKQTEKLLYQTIIEKLM